jgi:hypothetical protein
LKNRPLIYGLFALALFAIIWRISKPPQLPIPGPIGSPTHWHSTSAVGEFTALQISPDGAKIAGIWVDSKLSKELRSGLRIINTNDNTQIAIQLPENFKANNLSWNNDNVFVAGSIPKEKWQFIEVSLSSKEIKFQSETSNDIGNIISWPTGSKYFLSEKSTQQNSILTVFTDQGIPYGKPVTIPNSSLVNWNQFNILSQSGDCALVSVLPNTDSSGFPNVYFCDFQIGQVKLISSKLPGRIQDVLVSRLGALIVCVLRGKTTCLLYTPSDSKLAVLNSVPVKWSPNTLWPGNKNPLNLFVNDSLLQLDLTTLSITKVFTYKDLDSTSATWQTLVAGAQCFLTASGDYISVSVEAGEPDIRRFSKKESENKYIMTPILPR